MNRHFLSSLLGGGLYIGSLFLLCLLDNGDPVEVVGALSRYLATPTFAKEVLIALVTIVLVFSVTLLLAFVLSPINRVREVAKTTSVLYKVTPALALTPIFRRALPASLSMDSRIVLATVFTGLLIGFYPIFSTAILLYEEALAGRPGDFARTVGAAPLAAHIHVFGGPLLRGALIGSVTGFPLSVIGVIVGEMIVASDTPNIGYQVMVAVQSGRTGAALGAVLAATMLGLIAYALGELARRAACLLGDVT